MELKPEIDRLADSFESCSKLLIAIGDETRQKLIVEMMRFGRCSGVGVNELTEKTDLSRPAVSHHLQILKDAGIVGVRKEGTRTFYFFNLELKPFERLQSTFELAKDIAGRLSTGDAGTCGEPCDQEE